MICSRLFHLLHCNFLLRLGNLAHRHDPLRVMLMRCLVFLGLKLQLLVQLLLLCEQIRRASSLQRASQSALSVS